MNVWRGSECQALHMFTANKFASHENFLTTNIADCLMNACCAKHDPGTCHQTPQPLKVHIPCLCRPSCCLRRHLGVLWCLLPLPAVMAGTSHRQTDGKLGTVSTHMNVKD